MDLCSAFVAPPWLSDVLPASHCGPLSTGITPKGDQWATYAIIERFLRYGNANKHATGLPAVVKNKGRAQAENPGGYLQQSLSRDPERSADVDMISID